MHPIYESSLNGVVQIGLVAGVSLGLVPGRSVTFRKL